jgi:putative PIN family toxin of toxin-antitoxin system
VNPPPLPTIVLDTNVVLDWLFFADARARGIADRIESRRVRWVSTVAMRDELADVLGRDPLRRRRPDGARVLLPRFDSLVEILPGEPASPGLAALRCRDPDDQKFIDLAVAAGARWLLTRDQALLDLHRAAEPFGVQILAPPVWTAAQAVEPAQRCSPRPA